MEPKACFVMQPPFVAPFSTEIGGAPLHVIMAYMTD